MPNGKVEFKLFNFLTIFVVLLRKTLLGTMANGADVKASADSINIRTFLVERETFGLQQKIQWALLTACNMITALHLVASVFISADVNHRFVGHKMLLAADLCVPFCI